MSAPFDFLSYAIQAPALPLAEMHAAWLRARRLPIELEVHHMAEDMDSLRWLKTVSTADRSRLSQSQSTPTTSLWAPLHRRMDDTFSSPKFE
jgi:hypothetical protein